MGKKREEGEKYRLFVAIDLPEEVRERIAAVMSEHAASQPQARWVRKENLHLTLKFIGEYPVKMMDRLIEKLEKVTRRLSPFTASLGGCGGFPSAGRSRVVWVGMEKGEEEAGSLAAGLDAALSEVGVEREGRPFR